MITPPIFRTPLLFRIEDFNKAWKSDEADLLVQLFRDIEVREIIGGDPECITTERTIPFQTEKERAI